MNQSPSKPRLLPFLLGGALVFVATYPRQEATPLQGAALTGRILEIVESQYVDNVDTEELLNTGMNRMLRELDRNSAYYPPRRASDFQNEMNGTLFGIGVILRFTENGIRITHVLEDGPADRSGLPADSRLISIDGEECEDWNLAQVSAAIKGERGTTVSLVVESAGETSSHDPVRDEVSIPSLTLGKTFRSTESGKKYAMVQLQQFQPGTTEEVQEALSDPDIGVPLSGLIIDLRNNPGGVLEESVLFCSLFLEEGKEIVSTRNLREENETSSSSVQVSRGTGPWFDLPLVILIDGNSASASETVSAALRDHRRAVLVGENSFGKWTVQGVFNLDSSATPAMLKLTTDFFFPPNGDRLIYDDRGFPAGLAPDIEVSVTEEARLAQYESWSEQFYSGLADKESMWKTYRLEDAGNIPGGGTDDAIVEALKLLEDEARWEELLKAPPLVERSQR
ncbi:MAG: hypothetical protein CBC13_01535 [Planctomycetia bacterium TMED53]|nr:MAG: hypothetical protein CBC13_01535 [Planctomycetia bacterium TMED53]